MELNQNKAPIHKALLQLRDKRVVPFDVPGHKRGKGNKELMDFLGEDCLSVDVNSMKPLDNLCHPISVIKESEELMADAFSAKNAFLMVNGTTSSVQNMILISCKKNDKIILPRNVHRSVINALILNGANPIYINPQFDPKLGISLGMDISDLKEAIRTHPDAKAILINNPTYYGICSNIEEIVKLAHQHDIRVLVDEAHGTHFYFHEDLPTSAMKAGADLAAVSMHKSGGSLTQSSVLLLSDSIDADYARQVINLTQTTSASYLLLSSLDISRKNLALNGKSIFAKVIDLVEYARDEINKISGFYAYSREIINNTTVYDFDITKLVINTLGIGLTGHQVYDLLRDEYDIQIEFGDIGNILAYISVGDRLLDIERLVGALADIKRRHQKEKLVMPPFADYVRPEVILNPQDAFYSNKTPKELIKSVGMVSGEYVMCYPPGIPIIAPGERITQNIIDTIIYEKKNGAQLTGTKDMDVRYINVIKES
ncbi:MAG: aminotransferase class I/II-fold pyridoxal phosphate-dependent enzyme [Clostridia bacterium]